MSITEQVHAHWNAASCGTPKATAEKHTREYFEQIERFRYTHEPCIPAFAKFPDWRSKRVLEVGVGAGTDFASFAKAGAILSGVDLTEEAVENARARLAIFDLPAADLRVCNAEELPFPNKTFDLVYSWGVIHHANDTERCLREIARVVKSGGTVKLMLYNRSSVWAWYVALHHGTLSRRKAMWHHQESVGTKAYTEAEVRAMALRCGLQVRSITYADQLIREGARCGRQRRFLQKNTPDRWRWYMMIDLAS